ncbi:hypothetical protein FCE95_13890 [Luteimonas gilva]|uniref:Uncharacterized protein n=1 Tax=Luteimonas gilva TaxID=2572684 RepID=A0A4U5JIB3_9GAMM|nr:hypothetical protein [Luteimonas gilva]TKR29252.1 hypothetical protein FCE95_13890 [Luteimonas gilva]
MHPLDEAGFAESLLADPSIRLVDGPRWPAREPALARNLADIGGYALIWPSDRVPPLTARYVPAAKDWYCDSEGSTLQWLRSRTDGECLIAGRIALHDLPADLPQAAEKRLKTLYNRLRRAIKADYANAVVRWGNPRYPYAPAGNGRSANPSEPDKGLWVGPHALRWLRASPDRIVRPIAGILVEGRLSFDSAE